MSDLFGNHIVGFSLHCFLRVQIFTFKLEYIFIHVMSFKVAPGRSVFHFREVLINEPPRGKTNNVVSEQVRHKPTCTVTEKS